MSHPRDEKEDLGIVAARVDDATSLDNRSATDAPVTTAHRIWALHCPFTKTGFPSVGSFGSTVRPVIIIPVATWNRLCADIPALATTWFEVGSAE